MSDRQRHARLIREFHELQNRFYAGGEQQPVSAMLTENVIWHVPGESAIAGDYQGRNVVLGYFARRRELAEETFRITVRGVLADDERAVVLATGELRRGGETFAWGTVAIFRVAQGKVAECWVVPYDQAAYDRIWASTADQPSESMGIGPATKSPLKDGC